jgi:hemerythrin-like domain-containing protein
LRAKEYEVAHQAADHLLEYWETRIISHADAEEEGFYQEMIDQKPELKQTVADLTRDHDILRIIVADIKILLAEEGLSYEVMKQFHALLVVNAIHSRDEERLLLQEPSI